ncbi:MAG: formylglycine-generating enzyme family protein [Chloroflexi bacterium]|nr:MAG: formylglycine-generating enzyme family protein [Chloroflexota bacterium]
MIEPEVVVVPAGDALLGDPPRTEHVNVFAIARRPVRVGEYAMFVEETHHAPPREWERKRRATDHALDGVSWADAVACFGPAPTRPRACSSATISHRSGFGSSAA